MFFIGQDHFMYQLGDILTYLHENNSGANILFRGASGYGKTELATRCCKFLVGDAFEYCLGTNISFNRENWIHFIDEVHTMENPEILYPLMDSGIYVLVFATNFDSLLPEAFTNRCNSFIFTDYSEKDLIDIFKYHSKLTFSDDVIRHIIDVSGRNPRVMVKTFANVLYMHYYKKREELTKPDEELIQEIDTLFGIRDGLNRVCVQYLETLSNLGKRANVNLIASAANLDINTIKYQVEPILLYKKLIRITNRGRELL